MTETIPILETLLHPPLGAISQLLIPGLFTGSGDLTRATGALPPFNHVNAYGLTWTFFTIPAGFGSTPGTPIVYEERMLQASTIHTDFHGHDLISEWHSFFSDGVYWLWNNPGPTRVHFDIAPGLEIVFSWIVLQP